MAAWTRARRGRSPLVGPAATGSGRRGGVEGAAGAVDAAGDLPTPRDTAADEGARLEQRGEQRAQGPVAQGGAAGGAVDGTPGGPRREADGGVDAWMHDGVEHRGGDARAEVAHQEALDRAGGRPLLREQ